MTSDEKPAKLPTLRPRPTWLAAHRVDLSVYYRRLEREEFQMLTAIREGLRAGRRPSKPDLPDRASHNPAVPNAFASGLPTGPNWAGSAPPILNLCFKKRD